MTATSTNRASAGHVPVTASNRAHTLVSPGRPATSLAALNHLLAETHGPTTCLSSTMSRLAPFPAIDALPDAAILDVHLSLSPRPDARVAVDCKARYETKVSASEATAFYRAQLTTAGHDLTAVLGAPGGAAAHFDASLDAGRFCARVFDLGRITTVMVQTESTQLFEHVPFGDLANWHTLGPFPDATIETTEVFTVAGGVCAPIQAIYSTEYLFPGANPGEVRTTVDALLSKQGWPATETFEDSLLFDGTFGGEAHIAGADNAARLTLVGEFQLPQDEAPTLN